ncbi:M23 family metallopeptidase [Salinimonas marina]|uniref:M23 family metallopeptidase n=1 Tax=Salinimonas marina TaxID=2785918 RepID=A0A7S9DYB5_9ALTE|nr:M23 family metallopeptidase [Salinimonas marina]QPG05545.1 M23 family metallopeptidase [Salinimonas marina]
MRCGWWLAVLLLNSQPALARTGCFDNWFCFKVDARGALHLQAKRPDPVVVTLHSDELKASPVTVQLEGTRSHYLGRLSHAQRFWSSMRTTWTGGRLDASHNDNVSYQIPLQPAKKYPLVQGVNGRYSHQGASRYAYDFAAPVGTLVYAARAGTVLNLKQDFTRGGPDPSLARYANYISILHADGTTGEYYHLKPDGVVVAIGQSVSARQHIGFTGNTGFSSVPHLHFAVYRALPDGGYESVPIRFTEAPLTN